MADTVQSVSTVSPPLLSMILEVPLPGLRFDKREEFWEPVKGVGLPPLYTQIEIELAEFLGAGEESVTGHVMVARATKLGNCGDQRHAERMLDNSANIPVEFQSFVLVFPETIWQDVVGRPYFAFLYWNGSRWDIGFYWLDKGLQSDCRLVRLRK